MIRMQNIYFSYDGKKKILEDFSFQLEDGELLCVMGISGRGKSTLLRIIAGLEKIDDGKITNTFSKISYCFQSPRLFPWLTLWNNLKLVTEDEEKIQAFLKMVELEEYKDMYPNSLSGGMMARVNMARALCYDGDLLLFDEPFAALDENLRDRICNNLKKYLKENKKSAIFVLHQKEDAFRICDRILELN